MIIVCIINEVFVDRTILSLEIRSTKSEIRNKFK